MDVQMPEAVGIPKKKFALIQIVMALVRKDTNALWLNLACAFYSLMEVLC